MSADPGCPDCNGSGFIPRPGARIFRPGAIFQSRALGLWPDDGSGVWSPHLFDACCGEGPEGAALRWIGEHPGEPVPPLLLQLLLRQLPQVGADMAMGRGDDYHAIVARWGTSAIHHECSNVMDARRIFDRIREIVLDLVQTVNRLRPRTAAPLGRDAIQVKLDDDGTGDATIAFLRAGGYDAHGIGAACRAQSDDLYPSRRHELWFQVAEQAKMGAVHLGRLDRKSRQLLKAQLLAVKTLPLDARGRRQVERKDDTKKALGRSPDSADALNLCYLSGADYSPPPLIPNPEPRRPGQSGWRER